MYVVMGKVKQKNWLLIITVFLLISTSLVLFVNAKRRLGVGICLYNGNEYRQNELVPNFNGRDDCLCSWTGVVQCGGSEINMSYESFESNNLTFSYDFKNFLDKSSPNLEKITLADVKNKDGNLEITLEREALCTQGKAAPTQTGFYKQTENTLILTTVTNRDEALYQEVCMIGNIFKIADFNIESGKYSLLYQNESGHLYDLKACYFDGKLYGPGNVFKKVDNNELCTCEGPEIDCESL